jgi:membrane-associated phospholipid phosphatase
MSYSRTGSSSVLATVFALAACHVGSEPVSLDVSESAWAPAMARASDLTLSTRWNQRATILLTQRPPSNGQAAASRMLTYLSIAQYRASLAAETATPRLPIAAAVAGAASVVLENFFPLDTASIEAMLASDLVIPGSPGEKSKAVAAGEALGRSVGTTVVALAASDNYLKVPVGTPLLGAGYWVSNGTAIVPSLHGTRPFFLTSASQLRASAPPVFGSAAFMAALAEVRTLSDARTPGQLEIARFWNTSTGPFTAGALNLIADSLIRVYRKTEREAARILAFANAAAFDAQIACWDSKLFYWYIRPSQADPLITLPIGLPNHPSYPSGHSCITAAIVTVLMDAFPGEAAKLQAVITRAGLSRMYGGIHYRFDIDAGREIGRGAAALALAGQLD